MSSLSESLELGRNLHFTGRLAEAEQVYSKIVKAHPDCADAWRLLAGIAVQCHEPAKAEEHIRRAIGLSPDSPALQFELGLALNDQGKLDEALSSFQRAIELEPDNAEALSNIGSILLTQEKFEPAVAAFRRAIELRPDLAGVHGNLASALTGLGEHDEAAEHLRKALEIDPQRPRAHYDWGTYLLNLDRPDEAVRWFQSALQLKPDYCEALNNLGNAYQALGRYDEAAACFQRGLKLNPDSAGPQFNLALLSLLQGDWKRGWPAYECRWRTLNAPARLFSCPRWKGESLDGRTILISAEQGLGDTIQFVRYARLVKALGATVLLEAQPALTKLLGGCAGIDRLFASGEDVPSFDVHIPMASLPGVFNTTPQTIPADVPYLFADSSLTELWRQRVSAIAGFRIGINWQGRTERGPHLRRDVPLEHFLHLADACGARLISLQKGPGREGLTGPEKFSSIFDPGPEFDAVHGSFMDTAAIMMNLNLVVTSDTSVAHLAGALGVPVWVALPFAPDWRWMLDRTDSPWYPTMRLFRQKTRGDWAGVFHEIRTALVERTG